MKFCDITLLRISITLLPVSAHLLHFRMQIYNRIEKRLASVAMQITLRLATFLIYVFYAWYVFSRWISNLDVASSANKMCFPRLSRFLVFQFFRLRELACRRQIPDYHNVECQACVSFLASAWHLSPSHLTCFKPPSRLREVSDQMDSFTLYLLAEKIFSRLEASLWTLELLSAFDLFNDYSFQDVRTTRCESSAVCHFI